MGVVCHSKKEEVFERRAKVDSTSLREEKGKESGAKVDSASLGEEKELEG